MQDTKLCVVAQDPSLRIDGRILTTEVSLPREELDEGPRGHRFAVVDYDGSQNVFYEPWRRPIRELSDDLILTSAPLHAQNAYALAMRTLVRFERALGRRVPWAFGAQQLKIAPHAFLDANAYYSREHEGILFGYFASPREGGTWVYTSLAHDVVVHETTHAILDGMRRYYTDLSHPDQLAFHEGFADVVALLSLFSLSGVVERMLLNQHVVDPTTRLVARANLTEASLLLSPLLWLAEQMGTELFGLRRAALRRSVTLDPNEVTNSPRTFDEAHRRGEILVAVLMRTFVRAWASRLERVGDGKDPLHVSQVEEEADAAATTLLDILIKALDYCPPVDVRFGDYLSAILTSDTEVRRDDTRYGFRELITQSFLEFGIRPASNYERDGLWDRADGLPLIYGRTHLESLQRSPEEVFRFLWDNRTILQVPEAAQSHVVSVQPSQRVANDGFFVNETVAEYKQTLCVTARELDALGVKKPAGMPDAFRLRLSGGGVLVFDEHSRLKYHIHQRLLGKRQAERLDRLWELGLLDEYVSPSPGQSVFAHLHEVRANGGLRETGWFQRRMKPALNRSKENP